MAPAARPAGSRTPSPHSTIIRTPDAPRLGFEDSWEPYTVRKSARISSRCAPDRTPPPRAFANKAVNQNNQNNATVSPTASPRKMTQPAPDSPRQGSSFLTSKSATETGAGLGLGTKEMKQNSANSSDLYATGMLPTPSKTPQKPPNEKTATRIQSFARNLFPNQPETIPSPNKGRAKNYSETTTESSTAEEDKVPIAIFTDAQDRIPEKDYSEENPFFGSRVAGSTKKKSKGNLVKIPGEGFQSVEEASRRDDGMVYVFRGKKFFRKFIEGQTDRHDGAGEDTEIQSSRPSTRTAVTPRLLFQPQPSNENHDEEALTDVEEEMRAAKDAPRTPRTPKKLHAVPAKTPEAPKFAPSSPPDTRRTTRSARRLAETPMKATDRRSPFDSWPRTKEHKGLSPTTKRTGEGLISAAIKKTRA